jgi:hypothetical protein
MILLNNGSNIFSNILLNNDSNIFRESQLIVSGSSSKDKGSTTNKPPKISKWKTTTRLKCIKSKLAVTNQLTSHSSNTFNKLYLIFYCFLTNQNCYFPTEADRVKLQASVPSLFNLLKVLSS